MSSVVSPAPASPRSATESSPARWLGLSLLVTAGWIAATRGVMLLVHRTGASWAERISFSDAACDFIFTFALVAWLLQALGRRRASEQALRLREEWLTRSVEHFPGLFVIYDAGRRFRYVNAGVQRLTGLTAAQLLGRTDEECFPSGQSRALAPALAAAIESGRPQRVIAGLPAPGGGGELTYQVTFVPLLNPEGRVREVVAVGIDLTERMRAEEAVRAGNQLLRLTIESADIGLWELILATDTAQYSASWKRQLGYADDELPSRRGIWEDRLHPDDRPVALARMAAFRQQLPAEFEHEFRLRHKNGSYRHIVSRGRLIRDAHGRPERFVGVHLDLTDSKRVEADQLRMQAHLLEAQKLESLGLLAGSVAHDFNNLLVGVLTSAEIALLDIPAGTPLHDTVVRIQQAGVRMSDLARQMLAYSGRGQFNILRCDLNDLVREMTGLLSASISKKARLEMILSPARVMVEADITQTRQVIMNLLTNASEALGDQPGGITLATGICSAGWEEFSDVPWAAELAAGLYGWIEVADTGCGMPAEARRRIFEPFYSTKFTGRGLGLAAVQGIVRAHRGAILVGSIPGQGSRFRVYYPLAESLAGDVVVPAADTGSPWQGSGTVLLADDEEIVRSVLGGFLEKIGYTVLRARDGVEAVEVFRSSHRQIDAVLLDVTMPRLGGVEAFLQMRAIQADARVLLMSGFSEQEATERVADQGLGGFLAKPVGLQELSLKIKALLRS